MSPLCLPPSFSLIWLTVRELMLFQHFQDGHHGGHLGLWNGRNLAILNLKVTPMPPTKFRLNPTHHLGADVVWRFSRWSPWRPTWILEGNDFSHSESLCCSDASHQVSAHQVSEYSLGDIVWRFSRWPTWQPSWILEWNDFNNSKPPCGPNAIHQVWARSDLGFRSRCGFKIFKTAVLDSRTERF